MALRNRPHLRSQRFVARKKRPSYTGSDYENPRISPQLRSVFTQIGFPKSEPFKPDPFQIEALERLKDYDVLVSAATGSGKTWIAMQAIHNFLSENLRIWYASPLKALSNAIYQIFSHEFGAAHCGILTGDRKENATAPVIVGTTEILRNQLYDAMHTGVNIHTDLVILDEAHYLSDPERGVVWEEVLIYLPPRVKLLLLSATISNPEEICEWLEEIRETPIHVVRSEVRPVPLKTLFLFPDGLVTPLGGKKGLSPEVKKFLGARRGRRGRKSANFDFGRIINCLRDLNLLPAIFFLKSRMDCDRALLTCPPVRHSPHIRQNLKSTAQAFLKDYPHLERHRQMKSLVASRVGSHHGGQLPYWKVLVEKMMNKGYLEAIFSTSTVAAGVNFPARTVALVQSDRFNGHEFIDLTATELHQMIGRAGRRGKDRIGFGLVIPNFHQDPQLIYDLEDSPPEPLLSQIHINFSMALNLLLSHTPLEVKGLLDHSFAAFQEKISGDSVQHRLDDLLKDLAKTLPKAKCDVTDPYELLENIQKRSEIKGEIRRLKKAVQYDQMVNTYKQYLRPGSLFLHKNGKIYAVLRVHEQQGRLVCAAHNIMKRVRTRKRGAKWTKVDLMQIKSILDYHVEICEEQSAEKLQQVFRGIRLKELAPLPIELPKKERTNLNSELFRHQLSSLPCEECEHIKACHRTEKGRLRSMLREFRSLAMRIDAMGGGLWLSFKRHLRFLKETDFVHANDRLTPDGLWASKLRVDQPLLIAEAIRLGALDGLTPEFMAGGLAPFVWDRTLEVEMKVDGTLNLAEAEVIFDKIFESIEPIRKLKRRRGFESPPLLFWPAAALFFWTRGIGWDQLLFHVPVNEGDMASLIMRTADHLRQVTNLKDTHPDLASSAAEAIELILREPVYVD